MVNPDLVEGIDEEYTGYEPIVKLADGREVKVKEVEFSYIEVLGFKRVKARTYALEGLPEKMLVGQDIMQELGVTLRCVKERLCWRKASPVWAIRLRASKARLEVSLGRSSQKRLEEIRGSYVKFV